jgi:trehalose/maltose hydrolase-like predicted phosphorylase
MHLLGHGQRQHVRPDPILPLRQPAPATRLLCFAARLPAGINRLAFRLVFRNRQLRVEVRATETTYRLLTGNPLVVHHYGDEVPLTVDQPVT